jgi:hypothetical protein
VGESRAESTAATRTFTWEGTTAALARKGRRARCGRAQSRKAVSEDGSLVEPPRGEQRRRIRLGRVKTRSSGAREASTRSRQKEAEGDAVQQRLVRAAVRRRRWRQPL